MTNYTYTRFGEYLPFAPFITGEGETEVEHPAEALTLWSDEALAVHGIVRTEVPVSVSSVGVRLAVLADYRWTKTQIMPEYDGAFNVPADSARSVITSKVLAAQFMTEEQKLVTNSFKLKPGEWRDWNIYDQIQYGQAIGAYMQLCFDHERILEAEILVAFPEPVDITVGWPS